MFRGVGQVEEGGGGVKTCRNSYVSGSRTGGGGGRGVKTCRNSYVLGSRTGGGGGRG